MKIRSEQMDAFERDGLERFVGQLVEFLRTEAPRMTAGLDDPALRQFCRRCVQFGVGHGLEKQKHLAQLALCFLQMKVDFEAKQPPVWATQPREEGKMADDDEWLEYIRYGSRVQLSPE